MEKGDGQKVKNSSNVGSKVWDFFNSLKLNLTVLLSLAATSIIGTIIEQGKPIEVYTKEYGEKIASYIVTFGFHNMYHTWWFLALLGLLTANIIVCTIDRFPQKWKSTFGGKIEAEPSFIKSLGNNSYFTIQGGNLQDIKARVIDYLKRKRYKIKNSDTDKGASIYAWKGTIGRFGSDVTHVSLILILTGAILGSIFGFRDYVSIIEGETVKTPRTDFKLKLDKFWIDYYDSGAIKQFNSSLTVIEDGKGVLSKQIWVNEPLKYKGVWFYQSNYGLAYDRIKEAQLVLKNKKENKIIGKPFTIKWDEQSKIPDSNFTVRATGFVADFGFDEKMKQIYTRSNEHNNPAIGVEVYDGDKLISRPWLFLNYPEIFAAIPDTDYDLIFMGYKGIYFTGLQMTKDPGTNIVWLGSILMAVGFTLAFFIFYKRVWVRIKRGENGMDIYIGGMINKNKIMFEREFSELVESLKANVEVVK
ncbi:MAG: cytochrome c biogenesis protein ResB [Deltaproteobacteria bacterium]|nr:cytochrome c biogenesis protein ResB [Deltaproteobacteria bacterium]